MAESKRSPGRLSSFRDSVKKFTERLSDGDSGPVRKNDENMREAEKLRIQIQSMEEELRQLHQSRYQLEQLPELLLDRKSTRLNSSHGYISYAVFCLKKKKQTKKKVQERRQ